MTPKKKKTAMAIRVSSEKYCSRETSAGGRRTEELLVLLALLEGSDGGAAVALPVVDAPANLHRFEPRHARRLPPVTSLPFQFLYLFLNIIVLFSFVVNMHYEVILAISAHK
jgi:hypothetical protein